MENTISQVAFEFTVEKMAQAQKRLVIIIFLLIIALVGSNIAWVIYEAQFEETATTTTQTVEQNADNGENHFIGGDYNGNAESYNNDNNKNP